MTFFSWQMAEELAAEHMRQRGFTDARRTPPGVDAGVDVTAARAVAQVKYQQSAVGGPVVQQLRGAAHGTEHALFYASGGYTAAAVAAADASGVALFTFTTSNEVLPVNAAALAIDSRTGDSGDAELFAEARFTMNRFRAWVEAIEDLHDGPGAAAAQAGIGDERLTTVVATLEPAFAAATELDGFYVQGAPTVSRARIRKVVTTLSSATDAFATLVSTLPEPYGSRYSARFTELYLSQADAG